MLIHTLTPDECAAVLSQTTVGRLACARENQPYIVPVSFYYSAGDRCLYSFSTVGKKIEWMRANPRVCVQVDDIRDRFEWASVVVLGSYEEIGRERPERAEYARRLLQDKGSWWLPGAAKLADGTEHDTPVFYRILITTMTGRRSQSAADENK